MWAWLYHRSGSLLGPWLGHALVDAAIFVGYHAKAGTADYTRPDHLFQEITTSYTNGFVVVTSADVTFFRCQIHITQFPVLGALRDAIKA